MHALVHPADAAQSIAEYYGDPNVRQRMREDCGAVGAGPMTAAYVSGLTSTCAGLPCWERSVTVMPADLGPLWAQGGDIARSLWDFESLIFLLDLDYQSPDRPLEPFERPAEAFDALEPTYQAVRSVLRRYQLDATPSTTGRGYHFTGRVPLLAPVVARLAALVPHCPAWFDTLIGRCPRELAARMTSLQATAAAGLGLVVEFLGHQVLSEAQPASRLPVVLNGTVVGHGAHGRASASFDFSYVGDPLDVRQFRVLFGAYQWHHLRPDIFGAAAAELPALATLPRDAAGLSRELEQGRTLVEGLRRARLPAPMPDVSHGIGRAVEAYEASGLARFHRDFLTRRASRTGPIPSLDRSALPPCAVAPFDRPNDLLLKPEYVQHVVRVLMAHGWDPVDIAARIHQAYEADHDWGDRWSWMDRRTRADFDVQVFAGLVVTGHDRLIDLNCVSAQEKGLCAWVPCTADLRDERDRLRLVEWAR